MKFFKNIIKNLFMKLKKRKIFFFFVMDASLKITRS